jgi:Ca2+/Na+ antiporter
MYSILNSLLHGLEANSPNLYLVGLAGCILVGIFLLTKGGDILTDGASDLARSLGVHPAIIGLTVVSIATSAPELFTSLAAIAGDAKNLITGNIVGSNLANIGLVLGINCDEGLSCKLANESAPIDHSTFYHFLFMDR